MNPETKIEMKIPKSAFLGEVQNFAQHKVMDFMRSTLFMQEFKEVGDQLVALNKM